MSDFCAGATPTVSASTDAVATPAAAPNAGAKKGKGKKGSAVAAPAPATAGAPAPATTGGSPNPAALLDLLGSRIDSLESAAGVDESLATAEEKAEMERLAREAEAAMQGQSETEQIAKLKELYRAELAQRVVLSRQLASSKDKLLRSQNQKRSLEGLCKELQARNRKLGDEIRHVSLEQSRAQSDLQQKFSSNLQDIQRQIDAHSTERLAQAKENDELREKLSQLLKFDSMREEHFTQTLKTKELEAKLAEAKLAQQSEFAAAESKKAHLQQAKIEFLTAQESSLRAQLAGYADKFEQVQATLTKSNEVFASFKSEMEKTAAQLRKLEKQKGELEKKNAAAQLSLIHSVEERAADAAAMEKLRRQNAVLASLCKDLQAKNAAAAAGGANGAAALAQEENKEEATVETKPEAATTA